MFREVMCGQRRRWLLGDEPLVGHLDRGVDVIYELAFAAHPQAKSTVVVLPAMCFSLMLEDLLCAVREVGLHPILKDFKQLSIQT